MKYLLLFLLIFSASGLNAQLYVAPSENNDSYVYVRDRLLYVKNEITIKENKTQETQASVYLRKGSQLLQGEKSANQNTGNGKISIFQKGTSNAYDYNYWGMPVKLGSTGNLQLNDFIYEPEGKTQGKQAKLIAALDGISEPLHISSKWIYFFYGTGYSNWSFAGNHFDARPGEGFTMKGVNGINKLMIEDAEINSGSAQTYDFRGLPNDGIIELPIAKDQTILVGNPYPSALNLDKFLVQNTSSTGIAYFWDSRKNGSSHYLADYEGGYGAYSPGAAVYVPAVFRKYSNHSETGMTGEVYGRKFSPVAQGFMIIGKSDGKINFNNSQRIYQKEEKGTSEFKSVENLIPSLRLDVEMDSMYIRQLVLAFRTDSSPDEDHAMDARSFNQLKNDIAWNIAEEDFVINVRPKKDEELIPLKLILEKPTEVKFSIAEFINFNPERIFIYDARDDLYFGIKTGYLKFTLPAGNYSDRFYVSFIENLPVSVNSSEAEKPEIQSIKPPNILLNTIDVFQNNAEEQLEIKILYETGIEMFRLYDINGKLIFQQKFKGPQKEYYLPTGNLSTGIYIIKVNTSDNKELTKKAGIKN